MAQYTEFAQLGVEIKQDGGNELLTMLRSLEEQSKKTVTGIDNLTGALQKQSQTNKEHSQSSKTAEMSIGQLALRVAGYTSLLTAGVMITRDIIRETANLAKESVVLAASFEKSQMTWGVLVGDMNRGKEVFYELYDLAMQTSLSFKGVEPAAQMLKAFGVQVQDLIPTLKELGNLSMGDDQRLQLIAKSYGEMFASAHVQARNLIQMVRDGVPIYDALAATMNKTVGAISDMTRKGELRFEDVKKAVDYLNSEGQAFNNLMDTIATSTMGKWNITVDKFRAVLADTSKNVLPTIKKSLDDINDVMDKVLIKSIAKTYIETGMGDASQITASIQAIIQKEAKNTSYSNITLPGGGANMGAAMAPDPWQLLLAQVQIAQSLNSSNNKELGFSRNGAINNGIPSTPFIPKTSTASSVNANLTDMEQFIQDITGIEIYGVSPQTRLEKYVEQLWETLGEYRALGEGEEQQKEYSKAIITLRNALIDRGFIHASDYAAKYLTEQAEKFKTGQKKLPSDNIQQFTPYTDKWATMPGGGIPFLSQDEANSILESFYPTISKETWDYLMDASKRVPPDRWAKLPGGGIPYMSQEQAQLALSMMMQPGQINDFFGAPWMTRPQGGISEPPVSEFIPWGIDYAQIKDFFGAPWMMNPMGGINENGPGEYQPWYEMPWGNPEAQSKALGMAMNERGAQLRAAYIQSQLATLRSQTAQQKIDNEEFASRQQFMLNHNGMTPEEWWAIEGERINAQTGNPALAEELKVAGMNRRGMAALPKGLLEQNLLGSSSFIDLNQLLGIKKRLPRPSDPFWFYEFAGLNNALMNNGVLSESNWPEATMPLTKPFVQEDIWGNPEAQREALDKYLLTQYPFANIPTSNWQGTDLGNYLESRNDAGSFAFPQNNYVDRYSGKTGFEQVQNPNEVARLTEEILKQKKAIEDLNKSFDGLALKMVSSVWGGALKDFEKMGEALAGNKDAMTSMGDATRQAMLDMVNALPTMLLEAGLKALLTPGLELLGVGLITASGLVAIGAGAANYTASQEVQTVATPNALGNIYRSPSLSQYENGVFNTPHYFTFAKGGVFGEAGYEAIMPLARSVSGQLGVKASVAPVNVQVVNNVGAQVSTKETTDENGQRQLQILIDKAVGSAIARGKADKSMRSRFGSAVVPAPRM